MRKIAARNDMPRYVMTMTQSKDGETAVQFRLRRLVQAQLPAPTNDRDAARAAWIDSGRDPRTFDAALAEWVASGAPIAQFIAQYRDPVAKLTR
jgi:hypothetical protein